MKTIMRVVTVIMAVAIFCLTFFAFGEYRFFALAYDNALIADVSFESQEDFETFLKLSEENSISVTQATDVGRGEIDLAMPYYCIEKRFAMRSGRLPEENEFVSDCVTEKGQQSGIIRRVSPFRFTKVYSLTKADYLHFSSQYIFSDAPKEKIESVIQDLKSRGISIVTEANVTPWMVFLSMDWLYRDRLIAGLCFAFSLFVLDYYVSLTIVRNGLRLKETIKECLFNKTEAVLFGAGYLAINLLLTVNKLLAFFAYASILFFLSVLATILIQIMVITVATVIYKCGRGLIKLFGLRKGAVVLKCASGFVSKTIWAVLIMISISFAISIIKNCRVEQKNIKELEKNRNIYRVSMQYVGQDESLEKEVELQKIAEKTYKELTKNNNAFFMDSEAIKIMEAMGLGYDQNGLISLRGDETHITVSPNFFSFNPIFSTKDEPVADLISYEANVLNLIVPESNMNLENELIKRFMQYFDFNRFKIYERVYKNAENDTWNPEEEELKVNLIPVKDGQTYYTFSDYIHKSDENKIIDPTVVVYTDNFHPSYVLNTASRALFFKYDKDDGNVNEYLNEISGLKGFLKAESSFEMANRRLAMHKKDVVMALMWLSLNICGYAIACVHFKQIARVNSKNKSGDRNEKKIGEIIQKAGFMLLYMMSVVMPILMVAPIVKTRALQLLHVELISGIIAIIVLEALVVFMYKAKFRRLKNE
ncbi:MAG: hypothetical protein K5679_03300 [Lachnospiraceae bacterium]|nr:hypothetical protein [Lachnospiraceae bacterium]